MTSSDVLCCILELRLNHYMFHATSILFENECPTSEHNSKQSALSLVEFEISLEQLLWRCLVCYESSLILLKCSFAVHIPMIFCIFRNNCHFTQQSIYTKNVNSFLYQFCSCEKCENVIFYFYIQRMFFFKSINISKNQYSFLLFVAKLVQFYLLSVFQVHL